MKKNFLSDKLEELYNRETYAHPLQFRTKPDTSVTGEIPNEDDMGRKINPGKDDEESKEDLGHKGNEKDLGLKGNEKDLGNKNKSKPKQWKFDGPRVSVKQEK
jgi:hypothetical protein